MEITVNTITLPIWPASPPDVLTEPNVQPMFLNKNYNPDPICFRMSPLPISRQVGTMVWHFWRWFIIFTPTHLIGRKSMRDEGEKTFSLHLTSRRRRLISHPYSMWRIWWEWRNQTGSVCSLTYRAFTESFETMKTISTLIWHNKKSPPHKWETKTLNWICDHIEMF